MVIYSASVCLSSCCGGGVWWCVWRVHSGVWRLHGGVWRVHVQWVWCVCARGSSVCANVLGVWVWVSVCVCVCSIRFEISGETKRESLLDSPVHFKSHLVKNSSHMDNREKLCSIPISCSTELNNHKDLLWTKRRTMCNSLFIANPKVFFTVNMRCTFSQ